MKFRYAEGKEASKQRREKKLVHERKTASSQKYSTPTPKYLTSSKSKIFFFLLGLLNIAAGLYSAVVYYGAQISATHPLLWIFVADCSIYAILFGIVLLFFSASRPRKLLSLIALVGVLKYGIWVLFAIFLTNFSQSNYFALVVHILFLLETLVLFRRFAFKVKHFLVVIVWFLLNDLMDYYFLLHSPFNLNFFVPLMWAALLLSIFLSFFVSAAFSTRKEIA